MNADGRRHTRLRRLERVREVERVMAERAAAERRAECCRVEELIRRTGTVAAGLPDPRAHASGAALAAGVLFAGELARLARDTGRQREAASGRAQEAGEEASRARHRRDRVRERAEHLRAELERQEAARESHAGAELARNLKGTERKRPGQEN